MTLCLFDAWGGVGCVCVCVCVCWVRVGGRISMAHTLDIYLDETIAVCNARIYLFHSCFLSLFLILFLFFICKLSDRLTVGHTHTHTHTQTHTHTHTHTHTRVCV